jgi:biopolymer transport protein ExbB
MMMNRKILFVLLALALPFAASAQDTLDELLAEVQRAAGEEARIDQERLQRFIRERNNQRQLLEEARAELRSEEQRSDRLRDSFEQNELALVELETVLDERMGDLGELFGVVRQVAGDARGNIEDSMVSAQLPGRGEFLAELAERRELPTVPELQSHVARDGSARLPSQASIVKFNYRHYQRRW